MRIRTQIILWLTLYTFWLWLSVPYHPNFELDVIATTLLMVFYLAAVYLNGLVLYPRLWKQGKRVEYIAALISAMLVLTFIVFSSIRLSYSITVGAEYLGPYLQHFVIDLFGMAVHIAGAATVVWLAHRRKA